MHRQASLPDPEVLAAKIHTEIQALSVHNTPNVRAIWVKYSRQLELADPKSIFSLSHEPNGEYGYRGFSYELACDLFVNIALPWYGG